MRAVTVTAAVFFGLTVGAAAQMMGPSGTLPTFDNAPPAPPPGTQPGPPAGGGFGAPRAAAPPQQQQMPPCFQEFAPMRQEAEKRANVLKAAVAKKVAREEACGLIKSFSAAEAKVVNFVTKNAQSCGIPPQAVQQMAGNHQRTLKMETQVCNAAVGSPKQSGPGLSEALGTTRGGTLDPFAPQSGALDTLTGNVLSR